MLLFISLIAFCYVASFAFGFLMCHLEKEYKMFIPHSFGMLISTLSLVGTLYLTDFIFS